MKLKPLIFWLVMLMVWMPTTAQGNEVNVQAGNVQVRTDANGTIIVDTGRNRIQLQGDRYRKNPWWYSAPNHHSRNYRNCTSHTYQRSTQTTRVNGKVETSHISTSSCR
ncbi:hypothetical protein PCC7418_0811 [Halothece sp. PCC 7418]|uniref:hypothetical protein n=1 Tax=Halothece sp. (strain PCC 7418) TaxID=65093 RepID=UPI0002A06B77|nr:hypothetical protein [Halothece sp. PCC 7418]AFZ43026.1 hypothetical protein PCC7418_0811 [Halothece sp. PCC 7418]